MRSKGFAENTNNIETPNDIKVTEKPLNSNKISSGRVCLLYTSDAADD